MNVIVMNPMRFRRGGGGNCGKESGDLQDKVQANPKFKITKVQETEQITRDLEGSFIEE